MSDRERRRSRRSSSREPPSSYSSDGRRPPDVSGMTSLKVDNLSYRTIPEDLKPLFEKYGEVGDVYIPRDRFTKESRGFAFVRFCDKRDAEEAMDRLDGYVLDGREIRVQLARYGRPSEPPHVRYGKNYIPPRGKHERSRHSRSRSRSNSRSRSRTPRRRYSKSRSRSPRKYRRHSRSPYRGRSGSRDRTERRHRSTSKERSNNNDSRHSQKANSRSRSRSKSVEKPDTRRDDYARKSASASPRKEKSRSPKSHSPPAEEEVKSSHSNENVVIDECSPGMPAY